jgi:hypothetical protein
MTDDAKVAITTGLWVAWAQVAADAGARAVDARRRGDLNGEMAEAMTSISASAFAMEALATALAWEVDPVLAAKWTTQGNPTKAASRVCEVLKRSVALSGPDVEALASRWALVIGKRNAVVHFNAEEHEPVAHPAGVLSSQEVAVYTVEAAAEAVALLAETLRTIRDQSKPGVSQWLQLWSGAIDDFEQRTATS